MIDAIDTDMNARPGDAELIPWLLVLDCAPQHVAKEFRSIMRDTRSHTKLCYVQRNFTACTQPLDWTYMRAFKNSIRSEVAKHFVEFFLEVESNFERINLDSSTSVLRQLLLSFVHTAAQNADSPEEATSHQLSALRARLLGGLVPYADFRPHGEIVSKVEIPSSLLDPVRKLAGERDCVAHVV